MSHSAVDLYSFLMQTTNFRGIMYKTIKFYLENKLFHDIIPTWIDEKMILGGIYV